jgi:hypothetical protein
MRAPFAFSAQRLPHGIRNELGQSGALVERSFLGLG